MQTLLHLLAPDCWLLTMNKHRASATVTASGNTAGSTSLTGSLLRRPRPRSASSQPSASLQQQRGYQRPTSSGAGLDGAARAGTRRALAPSQLATAARAVGPGPFLSGGGGPRNTRCE